MKKKGVNKNTSNLSDKNAGAGTNRGVNKDTGRLIILVLSTLGAALSVYLTYLHYSDADAAFCVSGSGCDSVRESRYSAMFGIPVSLFGVIGYSLIFVLSFMQISSRTMWLSLYFVSLAGLAFSLYLTYLEFFVINAICSFCVISALIIAAIFIMLLIKKPVLKPEISFAKFSVLSGVVALSVFFGSLFIQSNRLIAGLDSDNTVQVRLAKHLGEAGAIMYGSYTCSHCVAQKELLGDAFKYVGYVECNPDGQNADPALCIEKGITSYPTWEINGNFYTGTRSLQQLAELSGYNGGNSE